MKLSQLLSLGGIATVLVLVAVLSSSTDETRADRPAWNDDARLPQIVKAVRLADHYDFAGEALPLDNFDVRERLERELMVNAYWHSSTLLALKNASRYFPVIEPILRRNGIPEDFKYLVVAESNFRNVTSPAGAKGFWQFLKGTAEDYGLEVNSEVDERYHLVKATEAACKYFHKLHDRFGSWTLVAAAYNMGENALARELERQQMASYYDLNLGEETNRYVFRIVALKEVLTQPEKFGFELTEADRYQPLDNFSIVRVDGPIPNLGAFARQYGTTYRMLKLYNPWLRSYQLSNRSGKVYDIRIPRD